MKHAIILTTRFLKNPHARNIIKPHISNLHKYIMKQPGFISSDSFWTNDGSRFFTITKWETSEDWDRWFESKDRKYALSIDPTEMIDVSHEQIDKYEHPEHIDHN